MKNTAGFSLVELLLVIVIIGTLAAIAVPNLVAAQRAANETSALADLKTLHQANYQYFQANDGFGLISDLKNGKYIESFGTITTLGCGGASEIILKGGYAFGIVPTKMKFVNMVSTIDEYYFCALPTTDLLAGPIKTGTKIFYIDSLSNLPMIVNGSIATPRMNPCSQSKYCIKVNGNGSITLQYNQCTPVG